MSSLPFGTLSYHSLSEIHNFGTALEPRWIVGTEFLDQ